MIEVRREFIINFQSVGVFTMLSGIRSAIRETTKIRHRLAEVIFTIMLIEQPIRLKTLMINWLLDQTQSILCKK